MTTTETKVAEAYLVCAADTLPDLYKEVNYIIEEYGHEPQGGVAARSSGMGGYRYMQALYRKEGAVYES